MVYLAASAIARRSWRYAVLAAWAALPFLMFHLTITTSALQVQARYHLPSLTSLALAAGVAGSALLRSRRPAWPLRAAPVVAVFFLAGMYAVAIDAELLSSPQERAEAWIRQNLDKHRDIAFISPPTYMPRSSREGYNIVYTHRNMTTKDSLYKLDRSGRRIKDKQGNEVQWPLIALSDKWYTDGLHFDKEFRASLFAGELGYNVVAEFGPRYTPFAAKGIFHAATWQTHKRRVLSPTIVIMSKGPFQGKAD